MLPRSSWRMSWIITCLTSAPDAAHDESGSGLAARVTEISPLSIDRDGELAGILGLNCCADRKPRLLDVDVHLLALDVLSRAIPSTIRINPDCHEILTRYSV